MTWKPSGSPIPALAQQQDKALPKSFSELEPKSQLIGFAIWLNAALDAMQEGVIARVAQKPVVLGPQ